MERQLNKDSEKIHPTEFMFTEEKELKINHNELPGWILARESSEKVWYSVLMPVNLIFRATQYFCEHIHLSESR